jgi:hypothetical protein
VRKFLALLREIEANISADLDIHLVMNNFSTHETLAPNAWLARHPG